MTEHQRMFSSHSALLGRDKLKVPTPHSLISATRGIHFFWSQLLKRSSFWPRAEKSTQITNLTLGAVPPPLCTLCTYRHPHTRHNNRCLDGQFQKTSPSVPNSNRTPVALSQTANRGTVATDLALSFSLEKPLSLHTTRGIPLLKSTGRRKLRAKRPSRLGFKLHCLQCLPTQI